MNTVNYITPSDGDIYLVNNQTYVNSGGTDFDKIYNNITVDDSLENIFAGAAKEFGINENFLKAVAQAESGFDVNATSSCCIVLRSTGNNAAYAIYGRKLWCYGSF